MRLLLPFALAMCLASQMAAAHQFRFAPHTTRVELSSASETATTHEVTVRVDPTMMMEDGGMVTYDARLYPPPGGVPTGASAVAGVGKAASAFTFTLPRPAGDHAVETTFGVIWITFHTSVDAEDDEPWGVEAVFEVVSKRSAD